jgi:L-asparaginase
MSMRAATARYAVTQLEVGKSVQEAVNAAIEDVSRLRLGVLADLVVHAIDTTGNARVVAINVSEETRYWYWREDLAEPQCLTAERITIAH